MDNDLRAELYRLYPQVFPPKNKHGLDHFSRFGFQVGTGWYKPTQELGRQLTAIGGVVVKRLSEERGALVVLFEAPQAKHAKVQQVIDAVAESCRWVCEVCGVKAALIPSERRVMCRKCALEEGVFESLEAPIAKPVPVVQAEKPEPEKPALPVKKERPRLIPKPAPAAKPGSKPPPFVQQGNDDLIDLMLGLPQEGDD